MHSVAAQQRKLHYKKNVWCKRNVFKTPQIGKTYQNVWDDFFEKCLVMERKTIRIRSLTSPQYAQPCAPPLNDLKMVPKRNERQFVPNKRVNSKSNEPVSSVSVQRV
mmetsp:Transcript_2525/g.2566  ORF Transcript_2525/g.2566 Transcript_2525/m.2566 type:complete len:107 (+) Transcript_2525:352-672(+)